MSKSKYSWICVNKDFHKQLKKEAAEEGKTIVDYTEELTKKVSKTNKKMFDRRVL